jgi:hypothetical protein
VDPRAIVRLEGLGQLKNPMTSSGIEKCVLTEGWRTLHDQDLHNVDSSPNIMRIVKSRRMRWAGYEERIQGFGGKPEEGDHLKS